MGGAFHPPHPQSRCPDEIDGRIKGCILGDILFILVSVLADGGEDFTGDPTTEGLGFRLVAADDNFIETCLIDDIRLAQAP